MTKLHREVPRHTTDSIKLMAIVHRLQQIMINENLTPEELVGCAGIVSDNYQKYRDVSNWTFGVIPPVNAPKFPPPRRP